jgi:hypothetical protein
VCHSEAFSSEVGTGSRKENAKRKEIEHFQAKHVPAKAGMGTGSRKENAKKERNRAFSSEACPCEGGDGHRFAQRKCSEIMSGVVEPGPRQVLANGIQIRFRSMLPRRSQ